MALLKQISCFLEITLDPGLDGHASTGGTAVFR